MTQAVLEAARNSQLAMQQKVQEAALQNIARREESRRWNAIHKRNYDWRIARRNGKRARRIFIALRRIAAIAQTREIQSLMQDLRRPIQLWGFDYSIPGCQESPGNMDLIAAILVTPSAIILSDRLLIDGEQSKYESAMIFTLEYAEQEKWEKLKGLSAQAGKSPRVSWIDSEGNSVSFRKIYEAQYASPKDMLFQTLADCANPRDLEHLFLEAI